MSLWLSLTLVVLGTLGVIGCMVVWLFAGIARLRGRS